MSIPAAPTQTRRPWRATVRTVFQAVVGFAAMWAVIVEAIGLDPEWQWVAASLAVTGAITRLMAVPAVEAWLRRFLPILAADPVVIEVQARDVPRSDADNPTTSGDPGA